MTGRLTAAEQERLSDDQFAFPKERKEPLVDASHVRDAIARFDQVEGVSDAEPTEPGSASRKPPRGSAWRCRSKAGVTCATAARLPGDLEIRYSSASSAARPETSLPGTGSGVRVRARPHGASSGFDQFVVEGQASSNRAAPTP